MTDPGYDARQCIRRSVAGMTGNLGDPLSAAYDPVKALEALSWLRTAAGGAERDAARKAREDGRSWGDIGEALGFGVAGPGVAEDAFRRFASDLGRGPVFSWTCPCGNLIGDRGPVWGNAADAEQGHAEGCKRFAETVRAWDGDDA